VFRGQKSLGNTAVESAIVYYTHTLDCMSMLCKKNNKKDVWKQAKLSVWKQNRSNTKNEIYLEIFGGHNS